MGAAIASLIPRTSAGARVQNMGPISGFTCVGGVAGPVVYDATGSGDAEGIYAVRVGSNTSQVNRVLDQTCPHLGCPGAWTAASNTFNCPCHGSVFNKAGQRIARPAPKPPHTHDFFAKNGDLGVGGGTEISGGGTRACPNTVIRTCHERLPRESVARMPRRSAAL